jgi:hypothetical protein
MRGFFYAAMLALSLLQPLTAQAQSPLPALEVSGVKYEQSLKLGEQALLLNGAGTRYKAVFQVYTAGLYLSAKANSAEAVLNAAGPKRLHIVMLREVDGNELGRLFTKGMEQNASREEFSKAINGVLRVAEIFSSRKSLSAGEHFSIDFIPGTGSIVLLNGKPQGAPIKEPEFYSALLRIWLGKSPADEQLKDALLGSVKEGRGRS